MIFQQRELILLPYPFSDQAGSKIRPAIIVSNDNFNTLEYVLEFRMKLNAYVEEEIIRKAEEKLAPVMS